MALSISSVFCSLFSAEMHRVLSIFCILNTCMLFSKLISLESFASPSDDKVTLENLDMRDSISASSSLIVSVELMGYKHFFDSTIVGTDSKNGALGI